MTYKSNDKSFFEKEREELNKIEQKGARKALKIYDFGASKLRVEIKKHPAQYFFLFISTFLGSVITSSVALFGFSGTIIAQFASPKLQARAELPAVETAPKVVETNKYDHLLLASKLRKNEDDIILIDIRSVEEFKKGHIVTAINVPVYESGMVTKEGDLEVESIMKAFSKLKGEELIVLYGPNSYSSLPGDIAFVLEKAGLKVKALAVGWEEWSHLQKN